MSEINYENKLKLAVAQVDLIIGGLKSNSDKAIKVINKASKKDIDLLVFPELSITGYPPEDLLLRNDFYQVVEKEVDRVCQAVKGDLTAIISFPHKTEQGIFNAAAVVHNKKIIHYYYKQLLPNYSVFDEKRYFSRGDKPCVFKIKGINIGLNICEDIWFPNGPVLQAKEAGAEIIVSINASPFCIDKAEVRKSILKDRAQEVGLPIVYAHNVGAQDELVFDGGSLAVNSKGDVSAVAKFFEEDLLCIDVVREDKKVDIIKQSLPRECSDEELVYQAIIRGLRTYVIRSGFKSVVLGLSGGIDSAVTLALAVAALGAENVEAVIMPSKYTSSNSIEFATEVATNFGVKHSTIKINPIFNSLFRELAPILDLDKDTADLTVQNLQARTRAIILMAISNKKGHLLLTTGNKSEMAVGYATLYGDMAGSYAPIKDLFKGKVYKVAKYINKMSNKELIPNSIIQREPTAELAPNQKDSDTLPPYDVLDGILRRYVELDQGAAEIIAAGYEKNMVIKVINLVDNNEYKRRQAAPGVRISQKAFGRDRRYPIVSEFNKSIFQET
tara:strand:+ start:2187 stop:3860 length:1674 start_codon:yes stop_codon:yes gene_type:complete